MGRSSPSRESPTKGLDYVFRSGKYQGKTVKEIVEGDPDYILFLHNKTPIDFHISVIEAAEEQSQIWNP